MPGRPRRLCRQGWTDDGRDNYLHIRPCQRVRRRHKAQWHIDQWRRQLVPPSTPRYGITGWKSLEEFLAERCSSCDVGEWPHCEDTIGAPGYSEISDYDSWRSGEYSRTYLVRETLFFERPLFWFPLAHSSLLIDLLYETTCLGR